MTLALGFKGGVLGIGEETTYGEHGKFVVDATNNKFDFTIGAGELNATIASTTYSAGADQTVAGSLCKAIYDAIVAAEATGTYTVTFDIETKKFTITRSAGTFTILWKTGTSGSDNTDLHIGTLIGFSDVADDTGALTYTADNVVAICQKFIEVNSDGLDLEEPPIYSGAIPGTYRDDDERVQGRINPGGSVEFEMRYEGFELLLKHAMGNASTAEVASFTVTVDSNDMIDFKEDAGGELNATLTPGTYIMGETAAASTLCLEIKTQLEAAGAGTYTVTFSNSTKKITIAVAGGAAAVQFLWKTGVSGSDNADESAVLLLGFTAGADGGNGASDTSDAALVTIFDHTLTHVAELPTGLNLESDRDRKAFVMGGGKLRSLALTQDIAGFLNGSIDAVGKDVDKVPVDTATLPTAPLVVFHHGTITTYDNSSINLTAFDITITNGLKEDRDYIGSRTKAEPKKNAKYTVEGNFSTEYENETLFDNFRAATKVVLAVIYTHPTAIKTGFNYSITINIPKLILDKALPLLSDEGAIMYDIPFTALATDSSTREMNIVIRNTNSDITTNNY